MTEQSSFWARRKAAVQAEEDALAQAQITAEQDERAQALSEKDDAVVLEEMGLPDPQQMQSGDDFSAFMSREVPEHLRRQALRTLWRSNPVLACVDGLNEYDDDYRAAMLLAEPIKTAYQVGKGMTSHIEEMERQAEEKRIAQENIDDTDADDVPTSENEQIEVAEADVDAPTETTEYEVAAVEPTQGDSAEDDSEMPVLRRMRFRFEEDAA